MHCVIADLKAKSTTNDGMVTSKLAKRQWLQGGGTSSLHAGGDMDDVHSASRITLFCNPTSGIDSELALDLAYVQAQNIPKHSDS